MQVDAQPAPQPEPAFLTVPLAITSGPGLTYWSILAWMLTRMPGSLALRAPGSWTPAGGFTFTAENGVEVDLTPFKSWILFAPEGTQVTQN